MTKRNRANWTTLLVMMSTTTNSYANPTCKEVIRAADKALAAQKAQIDIRDKELAQYAIMTKAQADELASDTAKLGAWYRSPYLYLFLGLAAGVYVGKR